MNAGSTGTFGFSIGEIDEDIAYKSSFGLLKPKTIYSYGLKGIDARPEMEARFIQGVKNFLEMKALSPQSGASVSTTGYPLVPIWVDNRIVDTSRKQTPLVELIPRVTNYGMTADFNIVSAKGAAYTAGLDAALPEADEIVNRSTQSIKFLYSVGRVLGQAQAAIPPYMIMGFQPSGAGLGADPFSAAAAPNAKQFEVLMRARALKELEENLIINGSVSTDATQFNGFIQQQSTTNRRNLAGAALSWDDIETSVTTAATAGGYPKLAVCPYNVLQDIRKLLIDAFRYTPTDLVGGTLPFGIAPKVILKTVVGDIPVLPSRFMTTTAGSKQLWLLDTDFIEMRVLQDMTYEDLAHTNDSYKFLLKIYECLIVRAPTFNAYIDNIA